MVGSSPLARGLRGRWLVVPPQTTDHPRSRGVYPSTPPGGSRPSGSSPLARGLQKVIHSNGLGIRIIPARAGFTPTEAEENISQRDHPRSRGVYCDSTLLFARISGSSPLARGLQRDRPDVVDRGGIIPARAGFTVYCEINRLKRRDHPRSRGVYGRWKPLGGAIFGSSPLARGLRPPVRSGARA